jgi:hypothetical protein
VLLIDDQQVEEAGHPARNIVGEREAPRPGPVGLPERATALQAPALLARQVFKRQRDAFVVHDLREARRAAQMA